MRQKKWKERIGGNSGLIIIGAFIILSVTLSADHLFNLPHLLSGTPPKQFEWGELVFDLIAIFCIGLISFVLVRKSKEERSKIEQIHWRERNKAQEYLDVAGVILVAINAEQKVTLINRKGCKILGYEEEEITGKNWFDHFLPEWDRERVRATFIRLMPGGQKAADYFENPILTKSGEERIIAWHNTLLTDKTGNITGTLSSGEDITERKKAEEQIAYQAQLLAIVNDAVVASDAQYRLTVWNAAAESMYGWKAEEVLGRLGLDITRTEFPDVDRAEMLRTIAECGNWRGEATQAHKDGTRFPVEVSSVVLRDTTGKVTGFVSVNRDITERKKAEEALKESEERFRQLAENIDQVFWLTDWDAKRLLYVNPAYERLYDRSCQSAYDNRMSWQDVIHPEDRVRVKEAFARSADLGQYVEEEYRIVRDDGTVRWVLDRSYPVRDKDGRIYRFASVAEDITERKQAEEALKESEEKFKTLAEESFDSIIIHNVDKILEVNRTFTKIWGYELDEIRGASVKKFITPESYEMVLEKISSGDEKPYEILAIKKDGTIFQIEIAGRQINYKGKKVRIVTARDITERKKVEESLRESEQKYRMLFEEVPVGIATSTIEGKIIDLNKAQAEMIGCTVEELKGRSVNDYYVYPDKRKEMIEVFKKIGKVRDFEMQLRRKDGSIITESLNLDQVHLEGKNLLFATGRDITERKRMEEALQEERNKLQAIIDSMEYGLTIQDRDYNIIFQNEALKGLFGNQLGEKCYQTYEFRDEICDGCPVRMAWADGKPHTAERKIVWQSGEIMFWENTASPIRDARGEIVACLEIARNISERKKAEEKLREGEERYKALFERSLDCVYLHDFEGNFLDANPPSLNLLGFTRDEIKSLNFSSILSEDQIPLVLEAIEELKEKGFQEKVSEVRLKHKNGEYVDVEVKASIIYRDGKPYAVQGIARDITERKKAEEELKKQKEILQVIFNSIPIMLVFYDNIGKIQMANKELESTLGWSLEELENIDLLEKCYPDKEYRQKAIDFMLSGSSEWKEFKTQIKDGKVIDTLWANVRLLDGSSIGIGQDITERKRAEEALRESEEKHRTYIENAPDGIFIVDSEARYIDVNEAACRMTGYSREELLNMTIMQLAPSDTPPEVFEPFEKLKRHGKASSEIVIQRKDGSVIHASIDAVALSDGRFMAFCSDVTGRKQAEEALRTSEERCRLLFEQNLAGVFRTTLDGQILDCNESIVKMFGYDSREEFLIHQIWDVYLDKSDRKKFISHLQKQRVLVNYENRFKRKDGSILWGLENASLLQGKEKGTSIIEGTLIDITERKKAEEAMRTSEEKYRAIVENATDQIFTLDRQCRFLAINKTAAEISRKSVSEMVGKSILQIFPKETAVQFSKNIKEVFETGQSKFIDERMYLGGRVLFNSTTLNPIKDDTGSVIAVTGIVRDITERKQAEEALRTSEERYRLLFERNLAGVFRTTLDGQILDCNESLVKLFGYDSRKEFLTHQIWDVYLYKSDRKDFISHLQKQKVLVNYEIRLKHKDGSILWGLENASLLQGKEKGTSIIEGTLIDITERKKVEEALRESEERYRALFEGSAMGILVADTETKEFKYANPAICKMLGYTEAELKQMSVADIHPKEKLEYVISEFEAQARGERTLIQDISCLRKDGTIIYADINTTKVTLDGREYNAGSFKDVTERKRAEEALRESEQRYRGVVDNIGIGVSLISPNLEILFLNNQMKKWFPNADISKEAICYRAFNSPPREEACSYCPTNKTLQDGQIHESITETPVGDKIVNYRIVSSPIKDLQGKVIAAIEMVEDITEKKRLQEQLIQTEKLAAVGTLAYGIAHEFNNILAGMMANAELGLISKENEQIKECFEIIVDNSKRASSITNNLLAFARHKEARKELIDITESLKSVLAIIHRELEKNNIEIIGKFRPIPKIYCDPGQFSEVFLNMITNARDAMHPKGGRLTIQVEFAGDCIRIIFKDTGCGIPEEIKGRIFEPFVTTKGALGKSEVPGTGLGLFLSYGIINGYKGKIEVETKVGKGTKFSIIIPISENQPRELLLDTRIESSKETEKKLKILLVDDEKAITLGLKKFLESKGHKVSTSLRAKQGLEIFRKGRFDLVLSDITIPDMDGIELIKKVKEKNQQTKIIVITGHLQKEKEEKARQAGADEVLIKPFRNELLYQTISKVVV